MPQRDDKGEPIFSIFFFRGLLNRFDNEELTFIYAHELAHCKLGHVEKKFAASMGTAIAFNVANIFLPGVALLNLAVNPLITSAYSRSQESEADSLAVGTMKIIGMNSEPAIRALNFLGNLAEIKGLREKDRQGIWDDHPSINARIENIKESDNQ
jgi:Zn-dependent protease with chaperone function